MIVSRVTLDELRGAVECLPGEARVVVSLSEREAALLLSELVLHGGKARPLRMVARLLKTVTVGKFPRAQGILSSVEVGQEASD